MFKSTQQKLEAIATKEYLGTKRAYSSAFNNHYTQPNISEVGKRLQKMVALLPDWEQELQTSEDPERDLQAVLMPLVKNYGASFKFWLSKDEQGEKYRPFLPLVAQIIQTGMSASIRAGFKPLFPAQELKELSDDILMKSSSYHSPGTWREYGFMAYAFMHLINHSNSCIRFAESCCKAATAQGNAQLLPALQRFLEASVSQEGFDFAKGFAAMDEKGLHLSLTDLALTPNNHDSLLSHILKQGHFALAWAQHEREYGKITLQDLLIEDGKFTPFAQLLLDKGHMTELFDAEMVSGFKPMELKKLYNALPENRQDEVKNYHQLLAEARKRDNPLLPHGLSKRIQGDAQAR